VPRSVIGVYLAHGVHSDERRCQGDCDRDGVFGGRPDLRQWARASAFGHRVAAAGPATAPAGLAVGHRVEGVLVPGYR